MKIALWTIMEKLKLDVDGKVSLFRERTYIIITLSVLTAMTAPVHRPKPLQAGVPSTEVQHQ